MSIKKLCKLIITFLVIMFFLSGCFPRVIHVTGVSIAGGNQVIKVGETLQLSVDIEPIDATHTAVFWESSDINKLTVNENGVVEAIAMPGAEITVITEDGEFEDTIAISVIPADSSTTNNPCDPCNTCDPCNQCDPCNPCEPDPCNQCDPCNPCDPCNTCEPECDPCNPCGDCYDPCECQSDPCTPCEPDPCNTCDPCGC